jgi:ABC-type multidrug transport system ATPase subunit
VSSHILPEVQQLADVVGIIDRGRLVRQGDLDELLSSGAQVRVRVAPHEVTGALSALTPTGAPVEPEVVDGSPTGRLVVRVPVERAGDVNRLLAEKGIYASGIESTSDLESVFLALTAGASMTATGTEGPPAGWGQGGAPA